MPAPPPPGCGIEDPGSASDPGETFPRPPAAKCPAEDGRRGAALGEERVRSCRSWNKEAAEEKAAEKPREQMGDCNRANPRPARGLLPNPPDPALPGGKESRSTGRGGMRRRGRGAKPYPLTGHLPPSPFPPQTIPGVPLPTPQSPGMRDLAWDGDEGHELGSPEPLRYQIRPPSSFLHAVLARPE